MKGNKNRERKILRPVYLTSRRTTERYILFPHVKWWTVMSCILGRFMVKINKIPGSFLPPAREGNNKYNCGGFIHILPWLVRVDIKRVDI